MKRWYCMQCEAEVKLGKHGQCEVCSSEAVDMISPDQKLTTAFSVNSEKESRPAASQVC